MTHYKLTDGGELAAIPEGKCKAGDFVIWHDTVVSVYRVAYVQDVRGDVVLVDIGQSLTTIVTSIDNIKRVLA